MMLKKRKADNNLHVALRRSRSASLLVLAGIFWGLFASSTPAKAGPPLTRESAQNTAIDGKAILLPTGVQPGDAGVIKIYDNQVQVPIGDNVAYVTISANGLGNCDGIAINCQVDGVNCFNGNGAPGTGLPNGWVVPLGDEYDGDAFFGLSGVNFQFCAPIKKTQKNLHTVTLFGATEFGDCNTYIEALHVYVDSNKIKTAGTGNLNPCGTYSTPNPVDSPD